MSGIAVAWSEAQDAPRLVKHLIDKLAMLADDDGVVWAKVDLMALKMGCSDRTVQRAFRDAVASAFLEETCGLHLHKGKLHPVYRMPLERGPANMAARLELEKAKAWGDNLSPQAGSDESLGRQPVTPTGDNLSPLGVTTCHPTTLKEAGSKQEGIPEGEGGRAGAIDLDGVQVEVAFSRVWTAWAGSVPDGLARPFDWAAWVAAVETTGDLAGLERAALNYLERSPAVKRGKGKSLAKWLAEEGWRQWAPAVAAPAKAAAIAPFEGPLEFRLAVRAEQLAGCGWDEAARAIIVTTNFYAERLRRDLRRQLLQFDINVIVRKPG